MLQRLPVMSQRIYLSCPWECLSCPREYLSCPWECLSCPSKYLSYPRNIPVMHQRISAMPQRMPIMPHRMSVIPQRISVMPLRMPVMPQRISVIPLRMPVMPQRMSVMPHTDVVTWYLMNVFLFRYVWPAGEAWTRYCGMWWGTSYQEQPRQHLTVTQKHQSQVCNIILIIIWLVSVCIVFTIELQDK